jgi:flagellum-specific peptidoglycan hydrolase FlgJ
VTVLLDSKRLFDKIREIKGNPLTQAEVDQVNAILAPVMAAPSAIDPDANLVPNSKIPMEVIKSARRAERAFGVPTSVTLAQWALESGWGKAVTGKNNYGGITAQTEGAIFPYVPGKPLEPATLCWTHEEFKGERVKCQRWFKDFDTPDAYFEAHGKLLGTSPIYAEARSKLPNVEAFTDALDVDYKPFAKDRNWRAYATDPHYAESLKSIMRSNGLYVYNLVSA